MKTESIKLWPSADEAIVLLEVIREAIAEEKSKPGFDPRRIRILTDCSMMIEDELEDLFGEQEEL